MVSQLRKPLVAAARGHAFSSGLGLIAAAHVAVATQGCTFGLTDNRMGIWPHAAFQAVSLAVGARRALELTLTVRIFGAPEALQSAGNPASASPCAIQQALSGSTAPAASPDFLEGVKAIKERRRPVWPSGK